MEISIQNQLYPIELKRLKDIPKIIYAKGNLDLLKNPKISIIGSRKNTEYGKIMALNFSKKLSQKGYTIVSGLANGIDYYSHIGGMVGKAKTIAVLPCGFNHICPKNNQTIYQQIIKNGGLVISEYPEEAKADKEKLIARNRIVASLSKGILVVEGDYRTGTTITAKEANKLGISVFCIPGNLDNGKSYTPNQLIKQGNILVTSEQDIIDKIENKQIKNNQREPKMIFEKDIENQYMSLTSNTNKQDIIKQYPIYEYIGKKPIDIDSLIYKSNLEISKINYQLTMLVVDGIIEELPGKQYIEK